MSDNKLIFIGFVLIIGFCVMTLISHKISIQRRQVELNEYLGQQVKIFNDTAKIIKANPYFDSFKLDNGHNIGFEYAKKNMINNTIIK